MMSTTHMAFSVAATSLALGTANPIPLCVAAIASQLPDIDTSKSTSGRFLLPISRWLEKRHPHRTLTHSFLASGIFTIVTYPIVLFWGAEVWQALVLGYFAGWFADVFTKSGVAAFYPSKARLVIPGNPRIRLSTGSSAEWFVLFLLVAIATVAINLNSTGGILRGFNQALGIPAGAIEIVNQEAGSYLLTAHIKGRNALTQQPIEGDYEVVQPLTQTDLLVKDAQGTMYRAGRTQDCQIITNQIQIERGSAISTTAKNLTLDDEELYTVMSGLPQNRTYLSGTLTILDAEDLNLPTYLDRFDTITIQPGSGVTFARLKSATPAEVAQKLGEYSVSGTLIVRTVNVK